MKHDKRTVLTTIIDCLIPGDGQDWPAAGQHGLTDTVLSHLDESPADKQAIDDLLQTLPSDFEQMSADDRETALRRLEATHPDVFALLVTAVYNMYYTDPSIRQIIERLTGYPARPPQPEGYQMEPFDESLLEKVRQRGPLWRKT